MIFEISNCNYAFFSAEEKRQFAEEYSSLFRYRIPFKMILTPEKPNNAIGIGFRNIYFSCEDKASKTVKEALSFIRSGFTEVSEDELTSVLCPEAMFCDRAECTRWSEDVADKLLPSLCYASGSTYSAVIVTFTPLDRREVEACMKDEKGLYRVKLEIITASDTPEQAKEYLDFLMDRASDTGCYELHRCSEENLSRVKKSIGKLLHNKKNSRFSDVCTEKICRKFIPFISAEVNDDSTTAFDYGINQITRNQLLYDRKHSNQPNGIVFGRSGSGKNVYVKNEILQVLEKTEDGVIVLDTDSTFGSHDSAFGYTDEIYSKLTRIDASDNFYINPLDIVIDTYASINMEIAEKADFITGLIETLLPKERKCNDHEVKLIQDAVYQVLTPFTNKLKEDFYACETDKRSCIYDFMNNPTLKDVLNIIMEHDSENVHELQELLKVRMPYLEIFCHKTMDFDNRIIFDLFQIPAKLEPTYYMVICSYMNNRMMINRSEQFDTPCDHPKRLWFYFDEADQIFQNKYFADYMRSMWFRSRTKGTICTVMSAGITELASTDQGRSVFNNSGYRIFLNQSPQDRKLMKEMLNVSDKMLDYVNERTAGEGIFYNNLAMIPFYLIL